MNTVFRKHSTSDAVLLCRSLVQLCVIILVSAGHYEECNITLCRRWEDHTRAS